jgi:hypothetical protein
MGAGTYSVNRAPQRWPGCARERQAVSDQNHGQRDGQIEVVPVVVLSQTFRPPILDSRDPRLRPPLPGESPLTRRATGSRRDRLPRPARRGRADRRDPGLVRIFPERRGGRPALRRPDPAEGGRGPGRLPVTRPRHPRRHRRRPGRKPSPTGCRPPCAARPDPRGGRPPARGVGEDGRPLGRRPSHGCGTCAESRSCSASCRSPDRRSLTGRPCR